MSKASRSRNREKRAQAKRARKQANQAQYQAWAREGVNSKSFRARKKAKKTKYNMNKGEHSHYCGNLACTKCFEHTGNSVIPIRHKKSA